MIHCEQEMIDNQLIKFLNDAVIYLDDDDDDYDENVMNRLTYENDLKVHKDVQQ